MGEFQHLVELNNEDVAPETKYLDTIEGKNEIGNFNRHFDLVNRSVWNVEDGVRKESLLEDAILVSSKLQDGNKNHMPVIDIDVPMRLVPSTTPGHHHLYIDVEMPWESYAELLEVMMKCGIVEVGYVSAALQRGATFVRLPWVRKKI